MLDHDVQQWTATDKRGLKTIKVALTKSKRSSLYHNPFVGLFVLTEMMPGVARTAEAGFLME
jgi:hypothetical protein